MLTKLLLFFTSLFSVFNPTNTRFNDSDIVKPSYNLNVDTGSNAFIVKVNLYDKDQITLVNTGSFTFKSKYLSPNPVFRLNEVLPNIYSHFWWAVPCSNPDGINIANEKSYSYDNTIKTFTYNYALTDINITGDCRFIKGDTNDEVDAAVEEMEDLLDSLPRSFFTSDDFIDYLNDQVFTAADIGYRYNFWIGGAFNSLSSSNNPNYVINSNGFSSFTIILYPEDYHIVTTKYLINAFYSNNGENGIFNSLISYSSIASYETNYAPTLTELSIDYISQSSFNLSTYKLSNSSFVDNVNHTASLYFYILSNTNKEVVDIWGLVFSIITLPFTFFSTAFNLTIFEGTPYAFNFSWFLISVLCLLILITLIKLILMFRS